MVKGVILRYNRHILYQDKTDLLCIKVKTHDTYQGKGILKYRQLELIYVSANIITCVGLGKYDPNTAINGELEGIKS